MFDIQDIRTRKQKLAEALRAEQTSMVNQGHTDGKDHELAINYLLTGEYDKKLNLYDYDILMACVEDLETMFNDYEIPV